MAQARLTGETRSTFAALSLPDALRRAEALMAGRPDLALAQAEAILDAVPGHPVALLILGAAHRALGEAERAAEVLRSLAAAQPTAVRVHLEWALTQAACGNPRGAIASWRHVLRLQPGLASAWRALAEQHNLAGERTEAEAAYAQYLRAGVSDPVLREAAIALCDNQLSRVEAILRTHLQHHATDVAALRMLAEAYTRLGRDEEAEVLLARCLESMPGFSAARHNLALVLSRQNKAEQALPQIERLLFDEPENPAYLNLFAAVLASLGEYTRSIRTYEIVVSQAPGQPKIWLSYGHVLKTAGRRASCVQAYRTSVELAPSFGEAWWSFANLKDHVFTDHDLALMRNEVRKPRQTSEDILHLHYALGFALERIGDYAGSFEHYQEGARLRRSEVAYDADRVHAQMQRSRALLTPAFFGSRSDFGCRDDAPIFIVGLPRSGSTLIEQILASHSAIEGTMELPEIVNIARHLRNQNRDDDRYPLQLAELSGPACAELGQRFLDRTGIYRKTGRPYFIDKLPNNFVHIGLIRLILPNAKIIDARRHPMAACFSAFKQHFARGQHFSYDLTELGRYYVDYVALMDHFDAVLPGYVHRVDYERMVEDTEGETRRLLAYLGLPFEDGCLRFHENARAVRTASSEQVRRPIYREGLDQWLHYEPWLAELRTALAPLLEGDITAGSPDKRSLC